MCTKKRRNKKIIRYKYIYTVGPYKARRKKNHTFAINGKKNVYILP